MVVAALLVVGCSGAKTSQQDAAPSFPEDLQRVVTPEAVVLDSTGQRLAHPFYGGLNVPRPQVVDVDQDGDLDFFLQERAGELAFFENVSGTPEAEGRPSPLVWRTDQFQDVKLGEWFRFADLDGDDDPDLLVERPYSYIRVYENTGAKGNPTFTLAVDTLRTASGDPLFSDRQNIPNVTDLDCNGRVDLFVGLLDGTITRYEEADTGGEGMPRFEKVTENFEDIEIVNQQMASARHGANTLTFTDVDGDGDEDLFWGDFFEPGLLLIENTGPSCAQFDLRSTPEPFPFENPIRTSGYNAPSAADWNGDGRVDLFVGVLGGAFDATSTLSNNLFYYTQTEDGFERESRQFLGALDAGSESTTAWCDLDGDGDVDGLLANKIDPADGSSSRVYVLENTGTASNPEYRWTSALDLPSAYHYAPALGDLTGDGVLDLVVGSWKGNIGVATGRGDGTFTDFEAKVTELPRGSNATPTLGDLDGDGDLDLVVGEGSGTLTYFENTGTPQAPTFEVVDESFAGVDVEDRSAPALYDVDDDGDLDLLVGTKDKGVVLVRNTGTPTAPSFGSPEPLDLDAPRLAVPAVADVTGDGLPDLVTGTEGGGLVLFTAPR